MSIEHIDLSLDGPNGTAIRNTAHEAGLSPSAWLAQATPDQVRNVGLRAFIDDYEAEHGAFTEAEMAEERERWRNAIRPNGPK